MPRGNSPCDPVGVKLGGGVGRAWVERRCFALRGFLLFAEQLRRGGLTEAGLLFQPEERIASSSRKVPRASELAVCSGSSNDTATWDCAAQVAGFSGLHLMHDAHQTAGVGHVAVLPKNHWFCSGGYW